MKKLFTLSILLIAVTTYTNINGGCYKASEPVGMSAMELFKYTLIYTKEDCQNAGQEKVTCESCFEGARPSEMVYWYRKPDSTFPW